MSKLKWEKCWKVNCSPALEVYKTHINYFGTNIDICELENVIKHHIERAEWLVQAKEYWEKEFGKGVKV